jgi:hypothetical protein
MISQQSSDGEHLPPTASEARVTANARLLSVVRPDLDRTGPYRAAKPGVLL